MKQSSEHPRAGGDLRTLCDSDSAPISPSADALGSGLVGALVSRALAQAGNPPVRVVLWDGRELGHAGVSRLATITIRTRRALAKILLDPEFEIGECYVRGEIEIEGDLIELAASVNRALPQTGAWRAWLQYYLRTYLRRIGVNRAYRNVAAHYELGEKFYALWLDESMSYTCAYYPSPETDLAHAQRAKLGLVAKKLRLAPGDRVVEAGSGWGALAIHLAQEHDVRVDAYNISAVQNAFARARAKQLGVEHRVRFIDADYRAIQGKFDVFVSVGMLEHVGQRHHRELGAVIDACLRPGGRGLIHSIGRRTPLPPNRWIQARIFPDGYVPTLREMVEVVEPYGFTIEHVENLRPHYARTLRDWLGNFVRHEPEVREMFDEQFLRTWRLYLASCAASFEAEWHQLYQVVFARSHR